MTPLPPRQALFLCYFAALIIRHTCFADDVWEPRSNVGAPSPRFRHTAVWTGTEMIVWGGRTTDGPVAVSFGDGARYSPATDTWTPLPGTGAPSPRALHSAIWTGAEMIIWGGSDSQGTLFRDGARYNPVSDTWTPIELTGAPSARAFHVAVWTGSQIIVWGGFSGVLVNDGAMFNPATGVWTPIATPVIPPRLAFPAIWTGTEMLVWGGGGPGGVDLNDGARYNPATDTWITLADASPFRIRANHSGVWTGTEMLIWGGTSTGATPLGDGARYNLVSDTWSPIQPVGAPSGRASHTAVWTGTEMIIWGGINSSSALNDGARYNPSVNTWSPMTAVGAPSPRQIHTAVWTENQMVVWGGSGTAFLGGPLDLRGDTFSYTPAGGPTDTTPPTAVAGFDQSVRAGTMVSLDGSGSFDDNTASTELLYSWSFLSRPTGSSAILINSDTPNPSFVADLVGTYEIQLVVIDEAGLPSVADSVLCSTENLAPTAVANVDRNIVILGQAAQLDGTQSFDPESDPLSYSWAVASAPAGSVAVLSSSTSPTPTFTPDVEGFYSLSLTVSDFIGSGAPDVVNLTVTTASTFAESQIINAAALISALTDSQVTNPNQIEHQLMTNLSDAIMALQQQRPNDAIQSLLDAIIRTDGCALRGSPDGPGQNMKDYITSCVDQAAIYPLLKSALDVLAP